MCLQIYSSVEEGIYGSVVYNGDKKEKFGNCIVEWIGVPWTDQETHQLMCDAVYWNSVPNPIYIDLFV